MNDSIMKLLRERYLLSTENSWDDIAKRVSGIYPAIYEDIRDMNFIPSSPTLMNYCENGERRGTLSSCFPMDLEDSIEGIYKSLAEGAIVTKYGGGVGYDFSVLRGSSEIIKSLEANSSGPVAFIGGFNQMLEDIRQGGKRRGAGMGLFSIEHPDILSFINAKRNLDKLTRLNLSVKIPSSFYDKLEKNPDSPHIVKNVTDNTEFELIDENGSIVTVKQLWDMIIDNAWAVAEPGIFNETIAYDRCTVTNISKTVICNPCVVAGTQVLTPFGYRLVETIEEGDDICVIRDNNIAHGKVRKKYIHENKEVIKIIFDVKDSITEQDKELIVTPHHQFFTNYGLVKAMDLTEKHRVWYYNVDYNCKNLEYVSIKDILPVEGLHTVYDLFESQTDTWITEGFISRGCSEFVNIPYTSCNLASINLSHLVDGKKFNWEKFEDLIAKGVRFLNSAIDKNQFPIEKIKDITLKTRPIGLGYMGLAHALYKKGIPYSSDKAIKFVEEMNRYYSLRAMKESVELSKEESLNKNSLTQTNIKYNQSYSYPAFDYDLFIKANERFFKYKSCREIDIQQLKEDIKKYGVRNSCFTSIAPTGSISFIAECSSGVEPVFALSYARKIEKENKTYDVVYISDSVFDEYLNKNFDEQTKTKILENVTENNGSCQNCNILSEEEKKIFVVAGDLTPIAHLDILEISANNTSLSVSKTINVPVNSSKDDISNVFLEAHKRGIIGVTVYRDGCREGILVHNFDKQRTDIIQENHAPKRPKKLPCDVHRVIYQGAKWIVFTGLLENKPYEIFAGKVEEVNLPKNIINGFLLKQKSGHYSFEYEDEILVDSISKTFDNKEQDAFARSISLALRHGTPLKYVVESLNKAKGDITHFAKVLARTLKKYMEDELIHKEVCPTCGEALRYESGCVICSNPECGFSKCS